MTVTQAVNSSPLFFVQEALKRSSPDVAGKSKDSGGEPVFSLPPELSEMNSPICRPKISLWIHWYTEAVEALREMIFFSPLITNTGMERESKMFMREKSL
jgi:hypothetical protein